MKYASLSAVFLVVLLGNAGAAAAEECPGADVPVVDTRAAESAVLCLANAARAQAGAPRLSPHPMLAESARAHAGQMVSWRFFGHVDAAGTFFDHLKSSGYADARFIAGGENLGWLGGAATPKAIIRAWLESPGHRANLLDRRLRDSGVAVVAETPTGVPGATFVHHLGAREEGRVTTAPSNPKTGKKAKSVKKPKRGKKARRHRD